MPYFKSLNILFIHIPKTGGSNIENFFFCLTNESPTISHVYSNNINIRLNNHSLQHTTYQELLDHKDFFNIDFNSQLKIISVVRNPYERIMSDLFFYKLADKSHTKETIEKIIKNYLNHTSHFDNHKIPQYQFLIDRNEVIPKNIVVLKNEDLNKEMKYIGYPQFEYFCKDVSQKSYMSYLTSNSISMINTYYKKDFEFFNYKMITF